MQVSTAVRGGTALLIALTLASCGQSAGSGSASGGDGGSQVLTVARTGDIDGLDIQRSTAFQTLEGLDLMYDTLFELDEKLGVVKGLAASSEYSEDGKLFTVKLRDGVKFHDGEPLDSAAVKATFTRFLDPKTGATTASNLGNVEEIRTPDPQTVEFVLKTADASLPYALAHYSASILSAKDAKQQNVTKPNGTGPFMFKRWAQGEALSLTANPNYWGGAPKLAGVDIRVLPDESSIVAGLRAGQFQIGILSDPTVVSQVSGGDLKLEKTSSLSYYVFAFNSAKGPLKNEKVRQAIACGIDRQEVIDAAAAGQGGVTGPFTSPTYQFEPFAGLPCKVPDRTAAKRMLAEAGYPNGFKLSSIVLTGEHNVMPNIAQSVQAQLKQIGIELKPEMLETNTFVERWRKADFESYITINSGWPDPHHMYVRYFDSGGNLNQVANWDSPEVDKLLDDGLAATDPAQRKQIYGQVSETLVAASPWVWLFRADNNTVVRPGVGGFTAMPNGSLKSLRKTTVG
jgi:peptide/nickel transport system substrate-binding protein